MTRQPITRQRAVEVAISLADIGGIESLSMRKLATKLGITPMSLYYHVTSKDDILDGMLDVIYGEIYSPGAGTPWRAEMELRARSTREVFARHPWAVGIDARRSPGPQTLSHLDAVIGCLLADGFAMPFVGHAMSLLDSYVYGFAVQEAALPTTPDGDIGAATEEIMAQQQHMAQSFPHLAAMATSLILRPGYAYAHEFDFGLELLLDGIAQAHARDHASQSLRD